MSVQAFWVGDKFINVKECTPPILAENTLIVNFVDTYFYRSRYASVETILDIIKDNIEYSKSPGRVGRPRSGIGRASTGSTATKDTIDSMVIKYRLESQLQLLNILLIYKLILQHKSYSVTGSVTMVLCVGLVEALWVDKAESVQASVDRSRAVGLIRHQSVVTVTHPAIHLQTQNSWKWIISAAVISPCLPVSGFVRWIFLYLYSFIVPNYCQHLIIEPFNSIWFL